MSDEQAGRPAAVSVGEPTQETTGVVDVVGESYLLRHLKLTVDLTDGLTENSEIVFGEVTERPMVAPC